MKNILSWLCILLTFNAYAEPAKYANIFSYKNSTERENGVLIKDGDIAFLTMYEVDCLNTDKFIGDLDGTKYTHNLKPGSPTINHYIFSDKPVSCLRMTITDTSEPPLTSKLSEVFKGYDFRTPAPMECIQ